MLSLVTHCIANTTKDRDGDYVTNRTLKYLCSILSHKPIVSFDWMIAVGRAIDVLLYQNPRDGERDISTNQVAIAQLPSWKPFLVRGDKQMMHCTKGGPLRALKSSKVSVEVGCVLEIV